jgi:hypothetical protein
MYEKLLTLRTVLGGFVLVCILACAKPIHQNTFTNKYAPPGSIKVNDTLFIDQFEISNIDYREFLYCMKKLFGPSSEMYLSMVPDSKVWADIDFIECEGEEIELESTTRQMLENSYFRAYNFAEYPVVGISYTQAKNFCTWRTNAVNAFLLKKEKKLFQDKLIQFSLIDYLEELRLAGALDSTQRYPIYTLPSEDILQELEWMSGFESHNKDIICDALANDQLDFFMISKNTSYNPSGEVANLNGNLAEMTNQRGIAYGGSWQDPSYECQLDKRKPYAGPSSWLGFRSAVQMLTYEQIIRLYDLQITEEKGLITKF